MPSSTEHVRIDAEMSSPIATTTRSNSSTASWRSASSFVESARTTCVSWPFSALHELLVGVDAEHLGAAGHELEGERAAEPAEADDGDRVGLGDAARGVGRRRSGI